MFLELCSFTAIIKEVPSPRPEEDKNTLSSYDQVLDLVLYLEHVIKRKGMPKKYKSEKNIKKKKRLDWAIPGERLKNLHLSISKNMQVLG